MFIALSQLNYHIGNFENNFSKIINSIELAKNQKVDLLIFSELAICGYPPLDLLEQTDFLDKSDEFIKKIANFTNDIAIIIGGPSINLNKKGKKLFNSAYFIANKKIVSIVNKTLLPTYDIFDEYRYFEPNNEFNVIEFNGKRVALTICEDLWDNQPIENTHDKSEIYTNSPMEQLKKQNPDFIVNIAASPFSYNQSANRNAVLTENAKKYNLPIFYVNQIGANTELIFDGGSLIINKNGEIVEKLNYFNEDFKIINLNDLDKKPKINIESNYIEKIHNAIVLGISDYFHKSGFKKATLGLSGGIDSAVVLCLAEKALGKENVRVLLMPSKYSSSHSIDDAVALAKNLDIKYDIIPIERSVSEIEKSLKTIFKDEKPDITEENIQARIRGILLMALSNKFNHILLNTTNKSEAAVGYGTLYGDMNGGISVLGDVYKTDVYKLAEFINKDKEIIPINTIIKAPSAELKPDQKDSDSLPEYDILDKILFNYIEQKSSISEINKKTNIDIELIKKIVSLVNRNEYKRFQAPPILRVSSKAFGIGRRFPIVAKY